MKLTGVLTAAAKLVEPIMELGKKLIPNKTHRLIFLGGTLVVLSIGSYMGLDIKVIAELLIEISDAL